MAQSLPRTKRAARPGARRSLFVAAGVLALLAPALPSAAADDAATGKSLYQSKCGSCHTVDANRLGPLHRNIVGRKVASAAGYNYSPALKKLGGQWTPKRLDQWLQAPQKMAPGNKMYLAVNDPVQRRAIIAYLQSVSTK